MSEPDALPVLGGSHHGYATPFAGQVLKLAPRQIVAVTHPGPPRPDDVLEPELYTRRRLAIGGYMLDAYVRDGEEDALLEQVNAVLRLAEWLTGVELDPLAKWHAMADDVRDKAARLATPLALELTAKGARHLHVDLQRAGVPDVPPWERFEADLAAGLLNFGGIPLVAHP